MDGRTDEWTDGQHPNTPMGAHSGQNWLFERKNSKIPNATFLSYLVLILFSIEYKPLCYYFFTCILFFLAKNDFFLLHQK
jgi:hypothetical protein